MGFLNILAYIGVGLAFAFVSILISYAMSSTKQTVLYDDGTVERSRSDGSWVVATFLSTVGFCIFATLLLINLAHFSILKSIGLGLLSGIALFALLFWVIRKKNADFIQTVVTCILNGAAFAILAYNWGWF